MTNSSRLDTHQVPFRPMRRIRQQLSEKETLNILESATSGVPCLLGDEGYPYGVPISHVYHDRHLYFHTALRGHKVDAIRKYYKASFTVITKDDIHPAEFTTYFTSVICFGRVRIIDDPDEKMAATRLLGHRFFKDDEEGLDKEIKKSHQAMHMIDFTIEHITGKEAIELTRMRKR